MEADVLRVDGVSRSFGGTQALWEATTGFTAGQVSGVIGQNGAGKTTLFNVISGFLRAEKGAVWLGNKEITRLSPHQRARRGIARTFQSTLPFQSMSVLECVMTAATLRAGNVRKARAIAEELLERVGWADERHLATSTLPMGHQKLVSLAMALAIQPRFLLLDEVLAGLNTLEAREVVTLIREIAQEGIGIVLIEHRLASILEACDLVTILNAGRVLVDRVPPQEALNRPDVIEAYLGRRTEKDAQ